jgi:hypothetical protein
MSVSAVPMTLVPPLLAASAVSVSAVVVRHRIHQISQNCGVLSES